jgi:site-specific recombinase XerD
MQDLHDLLRTLVKHDVEPVRGSIGPDSVSLWTSDQEERGNVVDSIAVRIISLKTFTNKYICKTLELTTADLLRKIRRPNPKPRPKEVLTDAEVEHLLAAFDQETFEDVRDRALIATLVATGLRRSAVRLLPLSSYDRVSGEFTVEEKGNVVRLGRLGERARKYMRAYLARRPERAKTDQLWVSERGEGLGNSGMEMIIRRAKKRSGITRVHAHLLRHGIAPRAADRDAAVGEIQTLLGHSTPAMARRYAGQALNRQGAKLMVQYSPLG